MVLISENGTATKAPFCCEADEACTNRCENLLKITAFIASLLLLSVATVISLVTTGFLTETFYLYSFKQIGQLASGIFVTLTFLSSAVMAIILIKSCIHYPVNSRHSRRLSL